MRENFLEHYQCNNVGKYERPRYLEFVRAFNIVLNLSSSSATYVLLGMVKFLSQARYRGDHKSVFESWVAIAGVALQARIESWHRKLDRFMRAIKYNLVSPVTFI